MRSQHCRSGDRAAERRASFRPLLLSALGVQCQHARAGRCSRCPASESATRDAQRGRNRHPAHGESSPISSGFAFGPRRRGLDRSRVRSARPRCGRSEGCSTTSRFVALCPVCSGLNRGGVAAGRMFPVGDPVSDPRTASSTAPARVYIARSSRVSALPDRVALPFVSRGSVVQGLGSGPTRTLGQRHESAAFPATRPAHQKNSVLPRAKSSNCA